MARARTFNPGGKSSPRGRKDGSSPSDSPTRVERFHTSATERGAFRSCRRAWYLDVVENLRHKNNPHWALIFGECIHSALEAYYKYKRQRGRMMTAFKTAWADEDWRLQSVYGSFYSMGIRDEWISYLEKGNQMLTYYDRFDKQDPTYGEGKIIAVNIEERAWVNILDPKTRLPVPGFPLLSGRIDLVQERKDGVYIWDHKTASYMPNHSALDIDDQLTAYCYIYWRITGVVPRGAFYNVLVKDPPKPPKVLQSGALSQDKSQRTTYDLYLDAIKENDLNRADYAEILGFLRDKGWYQFFDRDMVQKNLEELLSFEERLYYEYKDMKESLENPSHAYPNPNQQQCGYCSFLALCKAMEDGSNVEYLKENMYVQDEPRIIIPEKILSEKWKGV